MKFFIDFGTGAGNFEVEGTLEEAMKEAEKDLAYTQTSVYISLIVSDDERIEVAKLPWYGVKPEDDEIVTERFGDFGFYGEWQPIK